MGQRRCLPLWKKKSFSFVGSKAWTDFKVVFWNIKPIHTVYTYVVWSAACIACLSVAMDRLTKPYARKTNRTELARGEGKNKCEARIRLLHFASLLLLCLNWLFFFVCCEGRSIHPTLANFFTLLSLPSCFHINVFLLRKMIWFCFETEGNLDCLFVHRQQQHHLTGGLTLCLLARSGPF